jgi:hypothetical protein
MCNSGINCKSGDGGDADWGFGWSSNGIAGWVRNGILNLPTPTESLGFSAFLGDKAGNSTEAEPGIKRAEIWSSEGNPRFTFAFS